MLLEETDMYAMGVPGEKSMKTSFNLFWRLGKLQGKPWDTEVCKLDHSTGKHKHWDSSVKKCTEILWRKRKTVRHEIGGL